MLTALITSPPAPDMLALSLSWAWDPNVNFCKQTTTPPISRVKAALGHKTQETPSYCGILSPPPLGCVWFVGVAIPATSSSSTREIKFQANNWELIPRDWRPERDRARMLNGNLSLQHSSTLTFEDFRPKSDNLADKYVAKTRPLALCCQNFWLQTHIMGPITSVCIHKIPDM